MTGRFERRRPAATGFTATDAQLALMILVWGSNFVVIKFALEDLLPLSFNGLRFVIAAGAMVAITYATGRDLSFDPRDGRRLMLLGLLANTVYQVLFIFGIAYTKAGNAALIMATTPLFTAILGRVRGQEHFTAGALVGLALAFAGIALIVFFGGQEVSLGETAIGDGLMIAATITWAVYTFEARPYVNKYGSIKTTTLIMIAGTPLLLLISIPSLFSQNWSSVRPLAWIGMVLSGLLAIALAYIIWNQGVRKIGATRTAAYSNATPVVAMITAWLVLGETPTPGQLAGAAIILIGIYLVRRGMTQVEPGELPLAEIEEVTLRPGRS